MKNAIIYCRVSSRDQVEGTSLESQEEACRDYAQRHGRAVLRVFVEEGESAKVADRTKLLELLAFCKNKSNALDSLIVWKLDRFARNVEDHFSIKAMLRKFGVRVVSVTEPIDADPNGKLLETILAGFAQFDNDIRAIRTVQGMQQRLKEGIFPWHPPLGYVPPKVGKKTEPDRPDPRSFDSIQKAWRLYATGAYSKAAVLRLLRSWGVVAYRGNVVSAQLLDRIFTNPYYKGIVCDPWTGTEHPGRHVPMVTAEEFAQVQAVIQRSANAQPHSRLREEFPLRGVVRCPSCSAVMRSSFARGRNQRYPYYSCYADTCPTRRKSYPAALVHAEFEEYLRDRSVPRHLSDAIVAETMSIVAANAGEHERSMARQREDAAALRRQLDELIVMRSAKLVSDSEFTVQRERIRDKLHRREADIANRNADRPLSSHETAKFIGLLADLTLLWHRIPVAAKHRFAQIMFPAGYRHCGMRTADVGLLFSAVCTSGGTKSYVVPRLNEESNTVTQEIRRFLAIFEPDELSKQAA